MIITEVGQGSWPSQYWRMRKPYDVQNSIQADNSTPSVPTLKHYVSAATRSSAMSGNTDMIDFSIK